MFEKLISVSIVIARRVETQSVEIPTKCRMAPWRHNLKLNVRVKLLLEREIASQRALAMTGLRRKLLIQNSVVQQIGLDVVRGVGLDILTGKNLHDSTEALTRRRIATLNLATFELFLKGSALSKDFVNQLPKLATEILTAGNLSKAERWLAQWLLGLTDKAFQNVLRDSAEAIAEYQDRYIEICNEVVKARNAEMGKLKGEISINGNINVRAQINWLWITYLLNTIGAQTLAIRGSEKSAYGKLFEKLVLGSLLHILGFRHVIPPPQEYEKVFWLSSRNEKRESDATLLYELGKGVRFDIGFIGRGNPEISLDKVTRFEREISLGRSTFYMATIILFRLTIFT